MYLFRENTPVTDTKHVAAQGNDAYEHWAEGTYALFVAHQFKTWPSAWVNWTDVPHFDARVSDILA